MVSVVVGPAPRGPPLHGGRPEEDLSHAIERGVHRARNLRHAGDRERPDHELDGAPDQRPLVRQTKERRCPEEGFQRRADVHACHLHRLGQRRHLRVRRLGVREEAQQLAGDELRARRLLHEDVDHLFAAEVAGAAVDGLLAVVVKLRLENEIVVAAVPPRASSK